MGKQKGKAMDAQEEVVTKIPRVRVPGQVVRKMVMRDYLLNTYGLSFSLHFISRWGTRFRRKSNCTLWA